MSKDPFKLMNYHMNFLDKIPTTIQLAALNPAPLMTTALSESIKNLEIINSITDNFRTSMQEMIDSINLVIGDSIKQIHEASKIDLFIPTNLITEQWGSIFSKLSSLSLLEDDIVPDELQADFEIITTELISNICSTDLYDESEDETSTPSEENKPISWNTLFHILAFIIPMVFSYMLSEQSSVQLDKINQEQMQQLEEHHQALIEEERKQTYLQAENNRLLSELLEKINNNLPASSIDPGTD